MELGTVDPSDLNVGSTCVSNTPHLQEDPMFRNDFLLQNGLKKLQVHRFFGYLCPTTVSWCFF